MKKSGLLLLPSVLLTCSFPAVADPGKDESGRGNGRLFEGRDHQKQYKEEYWDGRCKVERKLHKSGEYKEERKCKAPEYSYPHAYPHSGAVYVPAYPVPDTQPGVSIHGTVRVSY